MARGPEGPGPPAAAPGPGAGRRGRPQGGRSGRPVRRDPPEAPGRRRGPAAAVRGDRSGDSPQRDQGEPYLKALSGLTRMLHTPGGPVPAPPGRRATEPNPRRPAGLHDQLQPPLRRRPDAPSKSPPIPRSTRSSTPYATRSSSRPRPTRPRRTPWPSRPRNATSARRSSSRGWNPSTSSPARSPRFPSLDRTPPRHPPSRERPTANVAPIELELDNPGPDRPRAIRARVVFGTCRCCHPDRLGRARIRTGRARERSAGAEADRDGTDDHNNSRVPALPADPRRRAEANRVPGVSALGAG